MRLALLALFLLASCSTPLPRASGGAASRGAGSHSRCGWIAADDPSGNRTFIDHAAFFDAIHPKWYALSPDGSLRTLPGAGDPAVLAAARAHGVAVIPMVASLRDPEAVRAALRDPAHVAALVALDYPGLDLDYEALWGAADRAAYSAFIDELAAAMHAAGKSLSVAVPGTAADKPAWPYDYAHLATRVDHIHLMAFDFHTTGTHGGPVAPQGWVESVIAHAAATGHPDRFLLGLPNYGVTPTWSGGSRTAAALCGADHATTDDHMPHCPKGVFAAGRSPNCETPHGHLYFDDLASLEAKVAAARAANLGGITYWHLGDEPAGFFAMISRHYP